VRGLPAAIWYGELAVPNVAAAAYLVIVLGLLLWGFQQKRDAADSGHWSDQLQAELDRKDRTLSQLALSLAQATASSAPGAAAVDRSEDLRPPAGVVQPPDPDFAPQLQDRVLPVSDRKAPVGPVRTW
jgi:hypothetical protein